MAEVVGSLVDLVWVWRPKKRGILIGVLSLAGKYTNNYLFIFTIERSVTELSRVPVCHKDGGTIVCI